MITVNQWQEALARAAAMRKNQQASDGFVFSNEMFSRILISISQWLRSEKTCRSVFRAWLRSV